MDLSAVQAHEPAAVTDEPRESAVIVPIIEREDPQLLFIKRAEDLANHAGEMSFPGGRRESTDPTLWETALREGNEEIGIDPETARLGGRLDDIRTITRFSVRPFVATLPQAEYRPRSPEVARVAPLSLSELTDCENYESEQREHPHHGTIRLHYFHVGEYTVWGATARILVQFLQLTTDWEPPSTVDRVVGADADFPV